MSAHLHFVGVGGVGMCGLAEIAVADGRQVSGCDSAASERTDRLVSLGVDVRIGHHPSHLGSVDALVVSAAVAADTEELTEARRRGLPVVRRSELLGEMMRGRRGVAIAGTHGKTTTTALLGHVLTLVGRDPTVVVGGRAHFIGGHGRRGSGDLFVCEADEYDRAFLDLAPEIAIVTTIEPEHLECYGDAAHLTSAFAAFANRCSMFGLVVLGVDDPGVAALRPQLRRRAIGYGISSGADLRAVDVRIDAAGSRFAVVAGDRRLGEVRLPLAGRHNVVNALAVIAAGSELGVPFDRIAEACVSFAGVARRFEIKGTAGDVTVVDDYAHHPTELRAVFAAARRALPGRRLVAVFQPHLFSRTRDLADDFAIALGDADVAVVLPVYPAREQPIAGVDAGLIVDLATSRGIADVQAVTGMTGALELLGEIVRPGDVVLTLGAGDVQRVGEAWLEARS